MHVSGLPCSPRSPVPPDFENENDSPSSSSHPDFDIPPTTHDDRRRRQTPSSSSDPSSLSPRPRRTWQPQLTPDSDPHPIRLPALPPSPGPEPLLSPHCTPAATATLHASRLPCLASANGRPPSRPSTLPSTTTVAIENYTIPHLRHTVIEKGASGLTASTLAPWPLPWAGASQTMSPAPPPRPS